MTAPTLYYVQAMVTHRRPGGWTACRSLPTFVLDAGVQGILTVEAAASIALRLLRDTAPDTSAIHVVASDPHGRTATASHVPAKPVST